MAGQYQTDVIGTVFSGVEIKNSAMVVSESPMLGKSQTKAGKNNIEPEAVKNKLTGRFDDKGYY